MLKSLVLQRLNDQFCQKYNNYITNSKTNKTEIINACNKDKTYDMSKYIKLVRNHNIRNTITRLRIAANGGTPSLVSI